MASEARQIARDIGQPQWGSEATAISAYLAAVDGDEDQCARLADAALADNSDHLRGVLQILHLADTEHRIDAAITSSPPGSIIRRARL